MVRNPRQAGSIGKNRAKGPSLSNPKKAEPMFGEASLRASTGANFSVLPIGLTSAEGQKRAHWRKTSGSGVPEETPKSAKEAVSVS
jgi:hypothetical protein